MNNPFSPNYKPQLSALTQTPRQSMLNGKSPSECKAIVLSQKYNGIHVTTKEASDESRRKAGRAINHLG